MTKWINCDKCGMRIKKVAHNHKYCKPCAYKVNLQKVALKDKTRKNRLRTPLGPYMERNTDGTPNFKAEKKAIAKEMKKLGLRK